MRQATRRLAPVLAFGACLLPAVVHPADNLDELLPGVVDFHSLDGMGRDHDQSTAE